MDVGTSHQNKAAAQLEEEEDEEEDKEDKEEDDRRDTTGLDGFAREKPFFPNRVTLPSVSVPLELSSTRGHKVPYTINRYLRDYQREGIQFMYNNYIQSRGCILGDDMGLGKTVQVIGFLSAILHKKGTWEDVEKNKPQFLQSQMPSRKSKPNKVFLIVAPLSVLYNWKDELDTWGHFQCMVVHGLRKEEDLARIKNGRVEIALTTYETLRICLDHFNNISWSAVFVDEAHKIKNPSSQITQGMKGLRCQIRVGLTGTILQNNLDELWCVMDWAMPGCLGNLGYFKNTYSDPIEQGQRHSATKRVLATGRKAVRDLVGKISLHFLRRTKALIKEQLPKKDDRVVYCSLTDFQQAVYRAVLDSADVKLLLRSSEKCRCQSGRTRRSCCFKTNSYGAPISSLYFSYLAILRKISNHVALLQSTGTSKGQEKYVGAICKKVFQQFPDFVQRCKNEAFEALSDPMYSGKMKVLEKLMKYHLKNKDKVLLFSYSTKLLDVLQSYCMASGLDYSRLDGNTKSKERIQIVKDFNKSTHVNLCLVSTMAGGLGLNFVGANVVILFDPTWNPANDLQAIDRAYRIGQCRDVTVFRLISLGTVEEVVYLRQVYKQQLQSSVVGRESSRRYFEAVQGDGVRKGELFGIKNLFRLQVQGTCLTREILEREGQVEAGVMTTSLHTPEEDEKVIGSPAANTSRGPPVKRDQKEVRVSAGVLDFSSDEDEDEQLLKTTTRVKDGGATESRVDLFHYGFSKLLQRVKAEPGLQNHDGSSGEDEETKTLCETPKSAAGTDLVQKSEAVDLRREDKTSSDDDPVRPHRPEDDVSGSHARKRPDNKFTDIIERFSSSEDERIVRAEQRKPTTSGARTAATKTTSVGRARRSEGVSFTEEPSSNQGHENIDRVLGGVREVVFTHSNQGVVGGSRAEARISRAAVRDVFQRNMYSQLPANLLVDAPESPPSSPENPGPGRVRPAGPTQMFMEHPVTFTARRTDHRRHVTVVIGETPPAVQRQQLQQMALKFNFSSVQSFSRDVIEASSTQRLTWLRQFYSSLDQPHLADVVTDHFPESSAAAQPPPSTTETTKTTKTTETTETTPDRSRPRRRKYDRERVEESRTDEPPLKSQRETPEEPEKVQLQIQTHDTGSHSGTVREPAGPSAALMDHDEDPRITEAAHTDSEKTQSRLEDLLGDTSILDDFFKPKSRGAQESSSSKTSWTTGRVSSRSGSSGQEGSGSLRTKGSRRDLWDVLDDEESINKLTDADVQQRCMKKNFSLQKKREEEEEDKSRSLWKTNDKFLWKNL